MQTPNSERSLYFDAPSSSPLDNIAMLSSQDLPPPVSHTAYALSDPVTVSSEHDLGATMPQPQPVTERGFEKVDDRENYPVVQHPNGSEGWLPAEELPANPPSTTGYGGSGFQQQHGATGVSRNDTLGTTTTANTNANALSTQWNTGTGGTGTSLARSGSRRSTHTASDGRLISGSAFVNGAGTTGPFSTADVSGDDIAMRTQEANATLTPKQRSKIAKTEAKNGRRLSKIIKQEAKTEKKSLAIAIDELANLQKVQKNAVKSEAHIQSAHAKKVTAFKKAEAAYLTAKMHYETAQAEMNSEAETLEMLRAGAREATEKVQDKSAEVDALRRTLAVDEREREIKLGELKGRRSSFWG